MPPRQANVRHVIVTLPITLGQFLKVADLASTGGEAKTLITSGRVVVNGAVDIRRGRKLQVGDTVQVTGVGAAVVKSPGATRDDARAEGGLDGDTTGPGG
jgi:ribosome-associated protein